MPTEKEIRTAIATVIGLAAPDATVIPRDAMGLFKQGEYRPLYSASTGKVRGWIITESASILSQKLSSGADYALTFQVWQLHEYFTGDDSTNSEDIASAEREAVMDAFSDLANVTGITQTELDALAMCDPISFSEIVVFAATEGGKLFHWARGTVTVSYRTTGC